MRRGKGHVDKPNATTGLIAFKDRIICRVVRCALTERVLGHTAVKKLQDVCDYERDTLPVGPRPSFQVNTEGLVCGLISSLQKCPPRTLVPSTEL